MKNKTKIKSKQYSYILLIFLLISVFFAIFVFYQKPLNQNQQEHLYFAYGSNMNVAQMKERCPNNIEAVGPAKLENYEFGFDSRGYANIRSKQGEYVWGFVWEIGESCISSLDRYEGYPNIYDRKEVVVKSSQELNAFVYIQPESEFGGMPQQEYLDSKIIPGAIENGLPDQWVNKLENISASTKLK